MRTPFIASEERGVCFSNLSVTEMSTTKNITFLSLKQRIFLLCIFFWFFLQQHHMIYKSGLVHSSEYLRD